MSGVTVIAVIASAIRLATPLLLSALGGVFSERSGVVNIGLEGIMIFGAFFSVLFTHITGNAWIGVVAAIIFGIVMAALLAVVSINLKGNQIIAGTAVNLLAAALTAFFLELIWHRSGSTPICPDMLTSNPIRVLEKLPVIGDLFKQFTPFIYIAIVLTFVTYYILWKTPWGLHVRAVGEHPKAADTVGIGVYKTRWICVLLSGVLAGLSGACLSIGTVGLFREGMVAGKGFIALAAMVFGKWHPIGAMGASFFFGICLAIQIQAQSFGLDVPGEFLAMVPYVATIIVLIGVVGKAVAPKADGQPYEKDEA
ncbi:MAG: ABC transporter permease [Clostridiales bacterium]|nr:ABC transporter permease [Clostridiales bacterium]